MPDYIRQESSDGDDWQVRDNYIGREAAAKFGLQGYWDIWSSAQTSGGLRRDLLLNILPKIRRMDVTPANSLEYGIVNHRGGSIGYLGAHEHNASGLKVGDHKSEILRHAIAMDYFTVQDMKLPMITRIEQHVWDIHREYARIAFPVVEDGSIVEVAYDVIPLRPVERPSSVLAFPNASAMR